MPSGPPKHDLILLTVVRPETDAESAVYVACAAELDDGEAMALGIAQCRHWQLATRRTQGDPARR